eukprot:8151723-Pyramimonas_sp.AAC.1
MLALMLVLMLAVTQTDESMSPLHAMSRWTTPSWMRPPQKPSWRSTVATSGPSPKRSWGPGSRSPRR